MVEKTYCDICGELVRNDRDLFDEVFNLFNEGGGEEKKYDLCKTCKKDIDNYIKKRMKEYPQKKN